MVPLSHRGGGTMGPFRMSGPLCATLRAPSPVGMSPHGPGARVLSAER